MSLSSSVFNRKKLAPPHGPKHLLEVPTLMQTANFLSKREQIKVHCKCPTMPSVSASPPNFLSNPVMGGRSEGGICCPCKPPCPMLLRRVLPISENSQQQTRKMHCSGVSTDNLLNFIRLKHLLSLLLPCSLPDLEVVWLWEALP